jgi:hypothetical protein
LFLYPLLNVLKKNNTLLQPGAAVEITHFQNKGEVPGCRAVLTPWHTASGGCPVQFARGDIRRIRRAVQRNGASAPDLFHLKLRAIFMTVVANHDETAFPLRPYRVKPALVAGRRE